MADLADQGEADKVLGELLAETVMLRAAIDLADRDLVLRSLETLKDRSHELYQRVSWGGALPTPASSGATSDGS